MCGIWCYCCNEQGTPPPIDMAETCVRTLRARGPEETVYRLHTTWGFGFTRLAINGLKPGCSQPFNWRNLTWMCNGEIYNHKELELRHTLTDSVEPNGSDCEVLGHLYTTLGEDPVAWARSLDGVFAIALYNHTTSTLTLVRDPYGVRPLYYGYIGTTLYAASEIKALPPHATDVQAFPPGHVGVYDSLTHTFTLTQYHATPWVKNPNYEDPMVAGQHLKSALEAAVRKRLMTERPIAALLSGGLDSSLIAALAQRFLKEQGRPPLETYSIGFPGSSDLKYARVVAEHIGSIHHEIVSSPEEFFAAIPDVIAAIESPDITSVRASVGNYLVAKYIRAHSPSSAKVVFNGDGSDEVFGSYLYFYNAPTDEAYEAEIDRLLRDIHHFDVLRSDRCIASNGLEPRTPFLDKQFVGLARSIPTRYLRPSATAMKPEKWLLRQAFAYDTLLPPEVLWRRKEAFSDGVSGPQKAWYEEVQERVAASGVVLPSVKASATATVTASTSVSVSTSVSATAKALTPYTLESYYYRCIYDTHYTHMCIPYYWLPRWSGETRDPSARTLKVYG